MLDQLRVLIVDDDEIIGEQAGLILQEIGATCLWVDTGQKAIDEVKNGLTNGYGYDVAMIDWRMPDMDGLETTRQIRKLVGPDTMIITISAYDWTGIQKEAMEAGANAFITKPLFTTNLYDTLGKVYAIQEEPQAPATYDLTGKHILLVEDNELNMEIAKELLEMQGIIVETACDGAQAVALVKAFEPDTFHAIIMDIRMPVMDGLAATMAIRSLPDERCQLPIIAMSANAFEEDQKKAREAGMNGYLIKPVRIEELYDALCAVPLK